MKLNLSDFESNLIPRVKGMPIGYSSTECIYNGPIECGDRVDIRLRPEIKEECLVGDELSVLVESVNGDVIEGLLESNGEARVDVHVTFRKIFVIGCTKHGNLRKKGESNIMKKMILTAVAAFLLHGAIADSVKIGDYTWSFLVFNSQEEKHVNIIGVEPKEGDVVVPSSVEVGGEILPVHKIYDHVFIGSKITSVAVSEGISTIENECFANCSSLYKIVLPITVTNLIDRPFAGCNNVKIVTWPGQVNLRNQFRNDDVIAITNISVALGSKEIVGACFSGCSYVVNVTIPEGVTNIYGEAFSGCKELQQLEVPASVKNIGNAAFTSCYSLTNVTFLGDAPSCEEQIFENANRDLVVYVPVGSKGWDGNPESIALPKYWPYNTEGGRRIVHIGETVNDEPPVITNYVYSTVTNYVFSTVTNEVFHYSTVTNEIFHYTTVTNVVKYVPEPGSSPDAGYGVNVGAGGETVIAGAAGWDAFGVPDGMEWDKETGTLSGRAKLSGAYDLILVSGSGADTKIMRTTLTVAPYDTIIGYVGVSFSQSGAPLDNLKSYKTLPAGLKWKNGTLSGVPTKAQALDLETADGEPVKIEIKALPDSVVGTIDGCVYFPPSDPTNGIANICDIGGTITLTATAAGKISASVKTAKKTYSFSMASWAKFAEGDAFTLEASAGLKTGEALQVNATVCDGATMVHAKLSGGEFGGRGTTTLPEEADDDGCVMMLAKDVYSKSGTKWINPEAHGLMAKCAGTYQFGFDAVEDGGHGVSALPAWTLRPVTKVEPAFLKIVVKDTGVATITGSLPDKTRINCTAKATATEEGKDGVVLRIVTAAFPGKYTAVPLSIVITSDGAPLNDEENCGMVYSVKR